MTIPIKISKKTEKENVNTPGLLDSKAGGKFIDQNYARKSGFKIQQLEQPLKAFNVDGMENKRRTIKIFVDLDLTIFEKRRNTRLFVTGLGKQKIILGFPWLNKHNPEINWKTGEFSWRNSENRKPRLMKINRKPTDNSIWLSLQKKEETMDNSTSMSKTLMGTLRFLPRTPTIRNPTYRPSSTTKQWRRTLKRTNKSFIRQRKPCHPNDRKHSDMLGVR